MGGYNSSVSSGDCTAGSSHVCSGVLKVSLNVQPRVGQYSRLIDLGADQILTGVVYNGTRLGGGAVNLTVRSATAAGLTFGTATTYSNVTPGATTVLSGTARYVLVTAQIDDSLAGTFADSVGGSSFITDITLNYTASIVYGDPTIRLRGGAFFSNGVLQPLNPQ
jgi:hypothetical protein